MHALPILADVADHWDGLSKGIEQRSRDLAPPEEPRRRVLAVPPRVSRHGELSKRSATRAWAPARESPGVSVRQLHEVTGADRKLDIRPTSSKLRGWRGRFLEQGSFAGAVRERALQKRSLENARFENARFGNARFVVKVPAD